MAELAPFRGLRYRVADGDELGAVLAPPYDVISAAQQAALYERSPYNIVRLEYSREPAPARYTHVARELATWRQEAGVLLPEAAPALYRYEQRFEQGGREYRRTAVIGRVRLEPIERGVIRPHEYTMAGPKQDRLALLRATRTNISPIFTLLDDQEGRFRAALQAAPPSASAPGDDLTGQRHPIERITDLAAIAALAPSAANDDWSGRRSQYDRGSPRTCWPM